MAVLPRWQWSIAVYISCTTGLDDLLEVQRSFVDVQDVYTCVQMAEFLQCGDVKQVLMNWLQQRWRGLHAPSAPSALASAEPALMKLSMHKVLIHLLCSKGFAECPMNCPGRCRVAPPGRPQALPIVAA